MKVFNRILVILYVLILLFVTAGIAVAMWVPEVGVDLIGQFIMVSNNFWLKLLVTLGALAVIAFSFKVIVFGIAGDGKPKSILIKAMENGQIRVNVDTLVQMALKATKGINGVRDVNVVGKNVKGNIVFEVIIAVNNGCYIPQITADVQKAVKVDVEAVTGLTVNNIDVRVDNSIVKNK